MTQFDSNQLPEENDRFHELLQAFLSADEAVSKHLLDQHTDLFLASEAIAIIISHPALTAKEKELHAKKLDLLKEAEQNRRKRQEAKAPLEDILQRAAAPYPTSVQISPKDIATFMKNFNPQEFYDLFQIFSSQDTTDWFLSLAQSSTNLSATQLQALKEQVPNYGTFLQATDPRLIQYVLNNILQHSPEEIAQYLAGENTEGFTDPDKLAAFLQEQNIPLPNNTSPLQKIPNLWMLPPDHPQEEVSSIEYDEPEPPEPPPSIAASETIISPQVSNSTPFEMPPLSTNNQEQPLTEQQQADLKLLVAELQQLQSGQKAHVLPPANEQLARLEQGPLVTQVTAQLYRSLLEMQNSLGKGDLTSITKIITNMQSAVDTLRNSSSSSVNTSALESLFKAFSPFTGENISLEDVPSEQRLLTEAITKLLHIEAVLQHSTDNFQQDVILAIEECTAIIANPTHKQMYFADALMHLARGEAYAALFIGNRIHNIKQAFADFEHALAFFRAEKHPAYLATVLFARSQLYREDITRDRSTRIEYAIVDAEEALQTVTKEQWPGIWANAHTCCGNAYSSRLAGDPKQNARKALEHYNAALTVYTPQDSPQDWTLALIGRGCARRAIYIAHVRAQGSTILDLFHRGGAAIMQTVEAAQQGFEEAVQDFTTVLTTLKREDYPGGWTEAHLQRASTYTFSLQRNRSYLRRTIADYRNALQGYTRQSHPELWATVHACIAELFMIYAVEDQQEDAKEALFYLDEALTIYTKEAMPYDFQRMQLNRAVMLERLGRLEEAHEALLQVREVDRELVVLAPDDVSRRNIIAFFARHDIYTRDALLLLQLDPPRSEEAAVALEEGRAQALRLALNIGRIDPQHMQDPAARQRAEAFVAARDTWRRLQQQNNMQELSVNNRFLEAAQTRYREQAQALEQAYHNFLQASKVIREYDDPDFLAPPARFEDITEALSEPGTALIYLVPGPKSPLGMSTQDNMLFLEGTDEGFAFIVGKTSDGTIHSEYMPLPRLTTNAVIFLFRNQTDEMEQKGQQQRGPLIRLERAIQTLGELGLNDVAHALVERELYKITIIPYGRLGLFPLAAVQIKQSDDSNYYLGDRFEITYSPSAYVAAISHRRANEAMQLPVSSQTIVTAGNPQPQPLPRQFKNLPYASAEADTLRKIAASSGYPVVHLPPLQITKHQLLPLLQGENDTNSDMKAVTFAHLAIHGEYILEEPRNSRLLFAGTPGRPEQEWSISLGEILDGMLDLRGLRLLLLSACQTSVVDIQKTPDEVVGISAAFLQAGVAGVIATLWNVDDRATYLLMSRFAQLYFGSQGRLSPASALAQAQHWLREEATYQVLTTNPLLSIPAVSEEASISGERGQEVSYKQRQALQDIRDHFLEIAQADPHGLPFADPQYWAAFIVSGC